TGELIARLTDDVTAVQGLFAVGVLAAATELGTAAVAAAWLLLTPPLVFSCLLAAAPAYWVLFRRYTPAIRDGTAAVRGLLDDIFARLKGRLDGMVLVKASAREPAECAAFAAQMAGAHAPRVRLGLLTSAFANGGTALGGMATAAIFTVAALHVHRGLMTTGQAVAAVALAALVYGSLGRLTDVASAFGS